ncbi:MAG: isoprenylcysteine carboxylmethyltransferase family protein, partial [Longimicrobiales bacterium]|nr:isoprenylcysteine carboxylmethyltransferase family protein [Longimicrobiales bacterium]
MMRKVLHFAYGVVAYAVFIGSFLYAIGFVGGLVVPKTIDSGATASLGTALLVDAALLLLFAVQHSGMARQTFKRWWTRYVPWPIERSTYVLTASLSLVLLFVLWRPIPDVVWNVEYGPARAALWTLFGVGWLIVFVATFMIGHGGLFGLQQVWRQLRGRPLPEDRFRVPGLYRVVRHPIMTGFLIAFWATPTMTVGHLLFATATTAYILVAIQLEERDLVDRFGDRYRDYRRQVPAFFPLPTGG